MRLKNVVDEVLVLALAFPAQATTVGNHNEKPLDGEQVAIIEGSANPLHINHTSDRTHLSDEPLEGNDSEDSNSDAQDDEPHEGGHAADQNE